VQQHKIDVRAWTEFPPRETSDGGKGGPAFGTAHLPIQLDQRRLDALCDQTPTIRPRSGRPLRPDRDVETLAG
jgi:hypothetical protein